MTCPFPAGLTLRAASLHAKLMLALAVVVALVVAGSAYFVIERERDRRLRELEERAEQFADLLSRSLAQPLWNVDRKAVDSQLAALSDYSELAEFGVTAVNYGPVSTVTGAHGPGATGDVVRVRPIEYAAFAEFPAQKIGEVRVVLSRAVTDEAIAGARHAIVLIAAAVIATLYAATFVLLKRMVGGPVNRLEEMVDRIAGGDLHARCPVESGDELGRLAARVNIMADRLRESTAQLRESERRYRNIFEAAGVSIWEEDFSQVKAAIDELKAQGVWDFRRYLAAHPEFVRHATSLVKIVDVNAATVKLFGARSKDELLVSLHRIFLPQTEAVFAEELIAIAEGRTSFEAETTLRTLQGDNVTVLLAIAFPPEPAQLAGVLVSIMDVTDRKRAEEALREAQAELARVTRVLTLGEITASIAHEVNQPLAGVTTNGNAGLRWLARDPPDLEEARECLRRIVRDGNRAGEVIARIRALVKKSAPAKARLDLRDTIQEVLAVIDPEARQHRVAVRTDLAAGLPPVRGDRVQVQQVLLNLVLNGIDAMQAVTDRPRELRIRAQPHEAGRVLVAVQDTGTGIDPQNLERIFTAFFTTKPEGMGLGLAISRSIIEAHGGRLWATPNDGPGATVQFTLPTGNGNQQA